MDATALLPPYYLRSDVCIGCKKMAPTFTITGKVNDPREPSGYRDHVAPICAECLEELKLAFAMQSVAALEAGKA